MPALPIDDTRITEALQTIGSIVEHDEGVPYDAIATALEQLALITRKVALAREQRLAGNIGLAIRIENRIDGLVGKLPPGAAW